VITARLSHPADREGFYRHLDEFLSRGVRWDEVNWECGTDAGSAPATSSRKLRASLPSGFVDVCDTVLLHQDSDRFLRLHRMAQRIHTDVRHWGDVLHPEHRHLLACARQVRRDMHKMKAFVRFSRVGQGCGAEEQYVAWFEPAHHIVQAMASFFVRRFANMRWAILTPLGSLKWDGCVLQHGPPAHRSDAPPTDAGEALWLTYYANIFNPARVKERAMQREMPVKYWKNLPEAALIPSLLADAPRRAREMVEQQEQGRRQGSRPGAGSDPTDALAILHRDIQRCGACECAGRATQAVNGEGRVGARVMLVGEQPGDREDLEGRPFVGPAGDMLRAAVAAAGVAAGEIFITNAVRHFRYEMRGKRRIHKTPLQQDILECSSWLQREYAVIAPRRIVLLGRTAITAATQCWGPAPQTGAWQTAQGAPLFVIAHPAALLRAGEIVGSAGYARWAAQLAAFLREEPGPY
jgi:uracil-DNA glycosylase